MKHLKIKKGCYVVAAYAESAAGPGWANSPIWIIVQDENKKLIMECVQPEDQTSEMRLLYSVSQAAHLAMTNAVRKKLIPE